MVTLILHAGAFMPSRRYVSIRYTHIYISFDVGKELWRDAYFWTCWPTFMVS